MRSSKLVPFLLAGGVVALLLAGGYAVSEYIPYSDVFDDAERANKIPKGLLVEVARKESSFSLDVILGKKKSRVGALGIMQFMPATAADLGIDPLDPSQAIHGAARYLAQLFRRFESWPIALAAYNWGQGNVSRKGIEEAPAETRDYVTTIMGRAGLSWAPPVEWMA